MKLPDIFRPQAPVVQRKSRDRTGMVTEEIEGIRDDVGSPQALGHQVSVKV